MPNWHSTHGSPNVPVSTPIGLVYGSKLGVCVWTGGEQTELISAQLGSAPYVFLDESFATPFWDTNANAVDPIYRAGITGTFGYMYPYVWCPNNWLYDIRYGSWWKLPEVLDAGGNAVLIAHWLATPDGRMIGVPSEVNADWLFPYTVWHPELISSTDTDGSFTWLSQPFVLANGRQVTVRRVEIEAKKLATTDNTDPHVTLLFNGQTENLAANSASMTIAQGQLDCAGADVPIVRAQNMAVEGATFTIELYGNRCEIRRIRIGYTQSAGVRSVA
jgi:hypothetical protein